jgi:hypothetical protein
VEDRLGLGVQESPGYEAFYGEDKRCYLRHVATRTVAAPGPNPHRPFSPAEQERRDKLVAYLDRASEDELIEEVLLPLFRQLGYARITPAGHKDKALEYGKDIWMYLTLPTQHRLYFGIQVKKDKLDAAGRSKGGNANVAEVHAQLMMMLGTRSSTPRSSPRPHGPGWATPSTPRSGGRSSSWIVTTS